jgi:hypothetical protein
VTARGTVAVLLFLDRLPLHWWIPSPGGEKLWSVSVPALVTERNLAIPPAPDFGQRWRIDRGCTGDTYAWRASLLEAGLDPRRNIVGTTRAVFGGGSTREDLLVRTGALWLFSNIPALRAEPIRLALVPGITFVNREFHGDLRFACPVIGMKALRRAGVSMNVDFGNDTVSLWVPSTWLRRLRVTASRILTGGRRVPVRWRD